MIETIGLGAGSFPEPDWCHEDSDEEVEDTYEQAFDEDYEGDMADYYHDEMMIGMIN